MKCIGILYLLLMSLFLFIHRFTQIHADLIQARGERTVNEFNLKSLLERNPENPDNLWTKKGFIFTSNDLRQI